MIHSSATPQSSSLLSLLCLLPSLLLLASSQVSGIETCQQDEEQPLEFRFFTDNNSWNDNGWTLECTYADETQALVWEVPVGSLKYEARTQVIREAACVPDTATCTLRIFDASGDGLQSSVLPTDENGVPMPINPLSDDIPESFSGWFAFLHGSTTVGTYQNVKWPNFSELTYCVGPNCEENQEQDASPQLSNNDENCQDIVYLAMQLDAQPQDTSYQLVCNNGVDIIWDGRDFTEAGSYVEEETCLPKDACCEFIITDTETNGLTSALDTTQLLLAGTTTQRSTGFLYLEWNFEPILEYDGATGEQFDVLTASFACGASTSGTTDVEATTTTITETVDIDNGTETITKQTEATTNTNTEETDTDAEADTVTGATTDTENENNDGNSNDPENDTDAAATPTEEMKLSNDMTETETATATATTEEDQKWMPYWEDPDWERRSQTAVPTDYFTNNGEWDRNDDDESWEYVRQETLSPTAWATFSSDDTAHHVYWGDDDAGSEDDDFTAKGDWDDEVVSWSSSSSDEDDQVMEDDDFTNAYVGYDDEVTMTTTEAPYVGYDDVVQEQLQELEELVIAADGTITQEPEDEPNRKVEPEQFVMGSSNNSNNLIVEKNNKKNGGISKGGKIATGIIGGFILLLGLAVLVIYFFGEKLFGKYLYDSDDSEDSDGIIKDHDTLEFSDHQSKEDDRDGVDEYLQTV